MHFKSKGSDINPTKSYIDEYGIDTDLSEDKFNKFKNDYKNKLESIFPGHTKRRFQNYFNFKIDLNKYEKLKSIGCLDGGTYQYNTLFCDIIVVGKTKIDRLERLRNDSLVSTPLNCIEIQEILKGKDILLAKYGKIPQYLYYGTYHSDENHKTIYNHKGIYFLWTANMLNETRPYLQNKTNSPILFSEKNGHVIERYIKKPVKWSENMKNITSKDTLARSEDKWNGLISKIKMIIEFNDAKNFYKRKY